MIFKFRALKNLHAVATIIFFFVCLVASGQVTDHLTMVWNDEFNGTTINSSKWSPAPEWPRQGGSYWSDENFEMTGSGQIRLKVSERNDSVFCGAIRTRNHFDKKYGYFEVRCKVPELRGGWGAFWLMPYQNKPGSLGNDGTEIDVFESINGWNGKVNHAIHWDGYGAEHQKDNISLSKPDLYDNKYHVFGMMWTPDEYIFYIDNKETWRTSAGGVSDVNQYLKLTLEVSDGYWAGNWNDQVQKPIYWLIDYVRVYNYQPIEEDVELNFTSTSNNQSFQVGDQIKMHVDVSGTLNQIDEIKFFTQKDTEDQVVKKTSAVTEATTYWYNWFPTEAGSYKLKAKGYKSGSYVTNVVINVTITENIEPIAINFSSLNSGDYFTVGDQIKMDVILTGDQSEGDEIHYLTKKDGGTFIVQKTELLTDQSTYFFNWSPLESGTYSFRVTVLKGGKYTTHVVVGGVVVQESLAPLQLQFSSLNSGNTFQAAENIPMDIELLGDLSNADEIHFMTKKGSDEFITQKIVEVPTIGSTLLYNWISNDAGTFILRATAYSDGSYVTHVVVADVLIENPLSVEYTDLEPNMNYTVGNEVNMNVVIAGNHNTVDQIKFISQKIGTSASVLQTAEVSRDQSTYWHQWIPDSVGCYKLKVTAYNSGVYVTHVTARITVNSPFQLAYRTLKNGQVYNIGDEVKMHVEVSGDLSEADLIKFIIRKIGGEKIVDKNDSITSSKTTYWNKWVPLSTGDYILKAKATKEGKFVAKEIARITVVETGEFNRKTKLNLKERIYTYPNPAKDLLTVDVEQDQVVYEIRSMSGAVLVRGKGSLIDIKSLATGSYLLQFEGQQPIKFFKE